MATTELALATAAERFNACVAATGRGHSGDVPLVKKFRVSNADIRDLSANMPRVASGS